jgi:acyl carrier protein phosphodiesterase
MNYLAHIYLSGDNKMIKIGNFMADSIRGKSYEVYERDIKRGILLHRAIDSFTDMHPIYRQSKHRLHSKYGHYSGVIMDIFYDHFLAKNWSLYSKIPLEEFTTDFYILLETNYEILTDKVKSIIPHMRNKNWLLSYSTIDGMQTIMNQMNHRIKNRVPIDESILELQEYYTEFESEFKLFFTEIQAFSILKRASL